MVVKVRQVAQRGTAIDVIANGVTILNNAGAYIAGGGGGGGGALDSTDSDGVGGGGGAGGGIAGTSYGGAAVVLQGASENQQEMAPERLTTLLVVSQVLVDHTVASVAHFHHKMVARIVGLLLSVVVEIQVVPKRVQHLQAVMLVVVMEDSGGQAGGAWYWQESEVRWRWWRSYHR